MSPTSHVWFATVEVLTAATLTKVEDVLPEEARAISDLVPGLTSATGTHNHPSVSSIATPVPEQHPSMATTLKHFKPHKMPPGAKMTGSLTIAPAVQAIIVDCVLVVDPQLAAVIGVNTETVMACLEDPQATCPAHSKVITSGKTRPFSTCVAIVHHVFPTRHVWTATVEILAPSPLTEVENVLPEETMTISWTMSATTATCTHNSPSVSSVRTMVPEEHASMPALLKHLKPHQMPSSTLMPSALTIAPAVQAIIVNCVSIVEPQLAPIIRDNAEMVVA